MHTPGPWTTSVAHLSDGSINYMHVLGPQGQGLAQVGVFPSEAETLANLNLFAAAPDLLVALREIELFPYVGTQASTRIQQIARAAIFKATGG
jgi:hypothetical protein